MKSDSTLFLRSALVAGLLLSVVAAVAGQTVWATGPRCCATCTVGAAGCCCTSRPPLTTTRVVYATVTRTKTASARGLFLVPREEPALEPEPPPFVEARSTPAPEDPTAAPPHLFPRAPECTVCPATAKVTSLGPKATVKAKYCCPKRMTRTATRKSTKTVYVTRTLTPDGTCADVSVGTDPDGECAPSDPSTCGTTGNCAAGACQLWPAGTSCGSIGCSGSTLSQAPVCNGLGTCVPGVSSSCAPYFCASGSSCATSCTSDAGCAAAHYCGPAGTCEAKKAQGGVCSAAGQCASGFCVDGVCCNAACDGTCRACSLAKTGVQDGTCADVSAGTDPDGECAPSDPSTCGTTGNCAAGACQLWPAGTSCGSITCSGSTLSQAPSCNGLGTCAPGATSSCAPYFCASGSSCATSCTSDAGCAGTHYCGPAGSCVPKLAQRAACSAAGECTSGFCVDGVCCDSACGGTCMACSLAKTGVADGTCANVVSGTDPDDECPATNPTTCGTAGYCSNGACQLHPSGTVCSSASCSGGTFTKEMLCDGSGTCRSDPVPQVPCSPYLCAGTATCATTCAADARCAPAYFCDNSTATCRAMMALGSACTRARECSSGFCSGGVCCALACDGGCRACSSAAGSPLPAGQCFTFPSGTVCGAAVCGNGVTFPAPTCDAHGLCMSGNQVFCAPYTCNDARDGCLASCSRDDQCNPFVPMYCSGGTCHAKKGLGEACTRLEECQFNSCVDGVCCDMPCSSECKACVAAKTGGQDGRCADVVDGTNPDGECLVGQVCRQGQCAA
ncbi:hypothetical protein DFJ74DRAFT_121991 [Hyaloraphidium curvatum]|nr:hypothetical protein DFJ74DRAFT_121991 [Hyaloraphidium curvatum]